MSSTTYFSILYRSKLTDKFEILSNSLVEKDGKVGKMYNLPFQPSGRCDLIELLDSESNNLDNLFDICTNADDWWDDQKNYYEVYSNLVGGDLDVKDRVTLKYISLNDIWKLILDKESTIKKLCQDRNQITGYDDLDMLDEQVETEFGVLYSLFQLYTIAERFIEYTGRGIYGRPENILVAYRAHY